MLSFYITSLGYLKVQNPILHALRAKLHIWLFLNSSRDVETGKVDIWKVEVLVLLKDGGEISRIWTLFRCEFRVAPHVGTDNPKVHLLPSMEACLRVTVGMRKV